jgi:sucrose-6-phosphate hydrolase SacC (GH32 family)
VGWVKRGLIYTPDGRLPWARSHAQIPTVDLVDDERWRIYFSTRDEKNRSLTTYIEVRADDPSVIVYEHPEPILALGPPGAFDDAGVMPAWVVDYDGRKLLYYCGWSVREAAPYEIQVGLATSSDGGRTWEKYSEGPVLGRIPTEPLLTSTPCIRIEDGRWRSWYLSGTRWDVIGGRMEPFYHLRYAESRDGVDWVREGVVAIDHRSPEEGGIARPSIVRDDGVYRMWFSYRGGSDFRSDSRSSYRIGYAESEDGIRWTRMDERAGIDVSSTGWDAEMVAYPHVFDHRGSRYLVYNGNGFGRTGFGYAVSD